LLEKKECRLCLTAEKGKMMLILGGKSFLQPAKENFILLYHTIFLTQLLPIIVSSKTLGGEGNNSYDILYWAG